LNLALSSLPLIPKLINVNYLHKEINTSAGRPVMRIKAIMKLNWVIMFDVPPLLTSMTELIYRFRPA